MFYDQPFSASRVGGGFPQLLGDSHARPYFPPGCPAIRGKATANPGSSFFSLCAGPKAVHGRPESADRTPLLKMVRRSSRLDSGAWEIGNIHVCEWSMNWNKSKTGSETRASRFVFYVLFFLASHHQHPSSRFHLRRTCTPAMGRLGHNPKRSLGQIENVEGEFLAGLFTLSDLSFIASLHLIVGFEELRCAGLCTVMD